jgi:NAD(P)-dependent dehydrogenase (short-subunit alcohol dehydrogenase family)
MEVLLQDKVVWVTGGGEGIGRAIALLAAQCGAKVAVTGRDPEPLAIVVSEIRRHGGEACATIADVGDSGQVKAAVADAVDRWGQLDIVYANAGTNGTWAPIDELTPEQWSETITTNLTGTYLTIHHAVPHMRKAGGSIIVLSSVNGTRMFSNEGATAYAASKAGQLALGKMLALELAPAKIRVNVICPGTIKSDIHDKTKKVDLQRIDNRVEYPAGTIPLTEGEMGDPQQVAQLAVFLASDLASHITGTPIWIDGAQSLLQG